MHRLVPVIGTPRPRAQTSSLSRGGERDITSRCRLGILFMGCGLNRRYWVGVHVTPVEMQKGKIQQVHDMILIAGEEQWNMAHPIPIC